MAGPTTIAGEQLQGVSRRMNRIYRMWQPIWLKLAHVREGIGGFLDGTYLVAHPREYLDHAKGGQPNPNPVQPSPKLLTRRALARYENFGGKIVDQMKTALFREEATRRVGKAKAATSNASTSSPIEDWWKNVDRVLPNPTSRTTADATAALDATQPLRAGNARTPVTKFWPMAWDSAATFGHMHIVMDRPRTAPGDTPVTQADQQRPFLRMYTPLDAIDWLLDDLGNLVAITFLELVQRKSLAEPERAIDFNLRVFTTDYWALYTRQGQLIEGGPVNGLHQMGRLPVVTLYAKRRTMVPLIGHSILDDPQLYIDVYNLTSEIREILRAQTFGMLNVDLGTDGDVTKAQEMMGNVVGSANVMFTPGAAKYLSPDASNLEAYQTERNAAIRTIYRLAAIAWEADTRDAESTDSLKIKRQDLNQMLSGFADELERAEIEVAELFYRALYGADGWETHWKTDGIVVHYPESFDDTPFDVLLAQAEAALALGMPPSFNKELRKRMVPKFLPDLPETTAKTITDDIEAGTSEQTPGQQLATRLMGAGKPPQAGAAAAGQTKELDALAHADTSEGRMTKVDQVAA